MRGEGEMECEGGEVEGQRVGRDGDCRRVRGRYSWGVMEGGRTHLGSLLPMSAFICGHCLCSVAGGSHLCSWVLIFVHVRGCSCSLVGGHTVGVGHGGCSCLFVGCHHHGW